MTDFDLYRMLDLDAKPTVSSTPIKAAPKASQAVAEPTDVGPYALGAVDKWDEASGREFLAGDFDLRNAGLSPEAAVDFFGAAWKYEPELSEGCTDQRRHAYLAELMQSQDYKALHATTVAHKIASEMAAKQFAEGYIKLKQQDAERKNRLGVRPTPAKVARAERAAEMDLVGAVGHAIAQAEADVEQLDDAMQALGCGSGSGNESPLNPAQIAETFKRIRSNAMLKRICELAGRYRHAAQAAQRQKVMHGQDDVVGIEFDGDVSRLLPSELALLGCGDEDLELDTLRRFVERQTLCRELRGTEKVAKGPIVVCVDESGSMDGEPVCNAKAFALAMAWVARHQNRWCCLVGYSHGRAGTKCVLPPGKWDEKALTDWLVHDYGGGTSMDVPLDVVPFTWWPELVASGMQQGKSDIIILTDGIVSVAPQMQTRFNDWKAAEKVKCISLILAAAPGGLEAVSDNTYLVGQLGLSDKGIQACLAI